jgi:hypothetical protein
MDWFEREPSIRDPFSYPFRVQPFIREKVLRYQQARAPKRHAEMMAKGAAASAHGAVH